MGEAATVRADSGVHRVAGLAAVGLGLCASLAAGTAPAHHRVVHAAVTAVAGSLDAVHVVSPTSVWAVGQTGASATLALHWNGKAWTRTPTPITGTPSLLSGLAVVSPSSVWAVGASGSGPLVLHWDGTSWARVTTPVPGVSGLSGVSPVSANDVWAVGSRETSTRALRTFALHWNGSRWAEVRTPDPGGQDILNSVTALSASDAWAVGRVITNHVGKTLVLHWNGTSWARVASPSPSSFDADLFGVSANPMAQAWAVGYATNNQVENFTLALHWNGTSWVQVPTPSPGTRNGQADLTAVSALTGSDAWAAGFYSNSAGGEVTLLLHWDGTSWVQVPSPSPGPAADGSFLNGVDTLSATDAWAVGGTEVSPGKEVTLLLHWNGTAWMQS